MILSHKQLQEVLQIKQNSKMMNFFRDHEIAFMFDGKGKCITSDQILLQRILGAKSDDQWEFSDD